LLLSQEQAFASHFPDVQHFLNLKQYERAELLMQQYFNYDDGSSEPAYWFGIYAMKGRARDYFVLAYQAQFCFNSGYLPAGAAESDLPFFYSKALKAAIDGDYPEANRLALRSFHEDPSIEFPVLVAGVVDELRRRREDARNEWMSVLNARRVLYPEQIGPSGPQIQAAEFLIHFRP